jgi:hypothetical protein
MTTPPRTYAQLAAVANAADRANRPTHLVAVAGIALVTAILFSLVSFRSLADARAASARAATEADTIEQHIATYQSLQTEDASLATYYPPNPYMDSTIEDVAKPYEDEFKNRNTVAASPRRINVPGIPGLDRYELECTIDNDPLQLSMRWITDALAEPENLAGRVFISKVSLTPINPYWRTHFTLAWYVAKQ